MNIFILEDCDSKFAEIEALIYKKKWLEKPVLKRACEFSYAQRVLEREKYDLLIFDLMVPLRPGTLPLDLTNDISALRLDEDCINRNTPAVALTQFEDKADEQIKGLNKLGITVITFSPSENWALAIERFIESNKPPLQYDFVIICALRKERDAYDSLNFAIGDEVILEDLSCKHLKLGNLDGLVITPTRMGLVSSAIACTKALERFKPKLIAMSGICAGFDSDSNIYDIIIPERCYQHDSGKWTENGFILEPYQVALQTLVRLRVDQLINKKGFIDSLLDGISFSEKEIPQGVDCVDCTAKLAVSSSGSSVVAASAQMHEMKTFHRKGVAFEMEAYALYEAASASCPPPMYFSSKCVVDNGTSDKSDSYHRAACLISAKACALLVQNLLSSSG